MTRLGLWGKGQTFEDFPSFLNSVENKGTGCIELIAIDMKLRGLYLARQLSFAGVDFSVQEVLLSKEFIYMYDESVKLWLEVRRQFQVCLIARSIYLQFSTRLNTLALTNLLNVA